MTGTCQSCGDQIDEWQINELGLCQDCDLERVGALDDEHTTLRVKTMRHNTVKSMEPKNGV